MAAVYVGLATVGAATWWFLYDAEGPQVSFHQLVSRGLPLPLFVCGCDVPTYLMEKLFRKQIHPLRALFPASLLVVTSMGGS